MAVPPSVTSLTDPLAPTPTTAMTWVSEFITKLWAAIPPKLTLEVVSRLMPVIVIDAPAPPVAGLKAVIVGGNIKLKLLAEVVEPPGAVNATLPVLPEPTVAVITVFELTAKLCAGIPPKLMALVPVKPLPLMVTIVPLPPDKGVKLLITGKGIKVNPGERSSAIRIGHTDYSTGPTGSDNSCNLIW